jgi:hypothetical protein
MSSLRAPLRLCVSVLKTESNLSEHQFSTQRHKDAEARRRITGRSVAGTHQKR